VSLNFAHWKASSQGEVHESVNDDESDEQDDCDLEDGSHDIALRFKIPLNPVGSRPSVANLGAPIAIHWSLPPTFTH